MKVIFAGGRDVSEKAGFALVGIAYHACPFKNEITEVVHGDATGIDAAAAKWFAGKMKVTPFPAAWSDITAPGAVIKTRRDGSKYNAAAGPMRNKKMAEYADALVAIWDGKSPGTKNMIETAEKLGLRVFVYRYYNPLSGTPEQDTL